MREFIGKKQRHLLWQDECDDDFLLLDFCEIYEFFDDTFRAIAWTHGGAQKLRKLGIVVNEEGTDEGLFILDFKREHLDKVLAINKSKKRRDTNSGWVKDKEERLAHRIFKYNPKVAVEEILDD